MADDGFGNVIPSGEYETAFTLRVGMTPRTGGEDVTAARLTGQQPFICLVPNCREMADVTVGWQLVDARNQDRVFNVTSPPADPDGKNRWLEFLAVQGRVG